MPTYEYQCPDCNHEFEQFQLISAPPIKTCPNCGKNKVKRLIGCGSGVIFKGSGFYQTDYRSESYQKAAKAEKEKATPPKKDTASSEKKDSSPKQNPPKNKSD